MDEAENGILLDPDDLLGGASQSGGPLPPGMVESGNFCAGCGYALDGLSTQGRCPECGMPVQRSLAGDLLRDAGTTYVSSLKRGADLIYWSLIASVTLTILGTGLVIAISIMSVGAGGMGGSSVQLVLMGIGFLFSLLGFHGWWLLSSPDPRHGPQQQGTARVVVRIAIAVQAVAALLSIIMQVLAEQKTIYGEPTTT